ncbi:MAG: hypothetical protein H7Y22_08670 [Gemmatimonadaceae bacterium]|nr:hypothetical protein [Gloeobacterales cyanobacterium ES-bin-141]
MQTGASGSSSNQVTLGSAAEPTHAPPSSITATPLSGGVALSWSAAPGALSYTVRRSTTSGSNYSIVRSGLTTTSYTNTGLANGTTYYYVVSAINEGGVYADIETANTKQVSAKPGSSSSAKLDEDSTSPYSPNRQNIQADSYSLTAKSIDNDGAKATSSARTISIGAGKLVLLVSGSATLNTADSLVKQRLVLMGFSVSVKADDQATSADANGKALVIISASVDSDLVSTKFRSVPVPVLNWESNLFDDMGMTDSTVGSDYDINDNVKAVQIVNPDHAMAAGLSSSVTVYTDGGKMNWGTPGTNAITIATTTGDEARVVVFGYESGAAMQGINAPARRVGLFLNITEANTLTEDGWALFEAAVRWASESDSEVLYVAGRTSLSAADRAVYHRLTSRGYKVSVVDDDLATSSDAEGKALVMISATSSAAVVNNKFLDVAVPVLSWEAYILDDLGMTNSSSTSLGVASGQTQVTIVNSSRPMAGGLSGTRTLYTASGSMAWGVPGTSAIKIATLKDDSSKVVIFGYEKGAAMPGMEAPARRVGIFLNDIEASSLNSDGWLLFDAAVRWAKGQ